MPTTTNEISIRKQNRKPQAESRDPSFNLADKILSIKDFQELFGVCRTTVYNWKKMGAIPFFYIGKRCYFILSEVLEKAKSNNLPLSYPPAKGGN